jgi:hypothetical protein
MLKHPQLEYSVLGLFAVSKTLVWIESARFAFLEMGLIEMAVGSDEISFQRKRDWILVVCELMRVVDQRVFHIAVDKHVIQWFLDFLESEAAQAYIVEVVRCLHRLFTFAESVGQRDFFLSCFKDYGIDVLHSVRSLNEEIGACVSAILSESENSVYPITV